MDPAWDEFGCVESRMRRRKALCLLCRIQLRQAASSIATAGFYLPLESKGYVHEVTFLRGRKKSPSELMPRVHQVVSLLKRWLMGTHQGAVSQEHLDYYLDEFTFRFNRRRSRSRGKLFFRLLQQAVVIEPVPYKSMIRCAAVAVSPDHKILGLHE